MYIYIYIYTHVYTYNVHIHIYIYIWATYHTPEINTSEIIADFQWHFPMHVQLHFQRDMHVCEIWLCGLDNLQGLPASEIGTPGPRLEPQRTSSDN